MNGRCPAVVLLLQLGADPFRRDLTGKTPLDDARELGTHGARRVRRALGDDVPESADELGAAAAGDDVGTTVGEMSYVGKLVKLTSEMEQMEKEGVARRKR